METEAVVPGDASPVPVETPEVAAAETVKKPARTAKPSVARPTLSFSKKTTEGSELSSNRPRTVTAKSAAVGRDAAPLLKRRNSTGGLPEKQPASVPKRLDAVSSSAEKKVSPSASESVKRSTAATRRASLPSAGAKVSAPDVKKPSASASRLSTKPENSKTEPDRKPAIKPSVPFSSVKKIAASPPNGSHGRGGLRKTGSGSNVSSPSPRSPSITNGTKVGSAEKGSGPKKSCAPENRDSRFIVLPQVEIKSGDDLRLDLRGHRIRSLNASGLNLSPNLEFVYLRDNLLSSLEGIEILKRVKVLDLSFNDFKGPGFEPLENCKALQHFEYMLFMQQLYLAGNQITSLVSLPQLPNLEVLAASKNKISTLKGFPHLPLLEHLRVEENPILEMPHLEAASILLVGPTLKKFNDR
ncbi:hypothetical protein Taro_004653, partial [Colocasia esculenta]|nr:hypothetical protein [Colocasia esculenta]